MSVAPHAASPVGPTGVHDTFVREVRPGSNTMTESAAAAMGLRLALVAITSLLAVIFAPVWVLLLSPLIFGLPHIAADLRWMIGRTPLGSEVVRFVAVALCLVAHVATGHLAFGLAAVPVAAVTSSATHATARRLRVLLAGLGLLLVVLSTTLPTPTARVFAQAHNAIALLVLLVFAGRVRPLFIGLLFVATGGLALALGAADGLVAFAVATLPAPDGIDMPMLARALGGAGVAGERYALLFAFGQLVHYGVWLWLLRSVDAARGSVSTPREELGASTWSVVLGAAAVGTVALAVWGVADVLAARQGYFRFALFHGALELAALTVLALGFVERERSDTRPRPDRAPSS